MTCTDVAANIPGLLANKAGERVIPKKTRGFLPMSNSTEEKLLQGLLKAINGAPMRLTGPTGMFSGRGGSGLADQAINLGYLEHCDPPPLVRPSRNRTRPAPHGQITTKGRDWVQQQAKPSELLKELLAALEKQRDVLRGEADVSVVQAQLANLQHSFNEVQQAIQVLTVQNRSSSTRSLDTLEAVSQQVRLLLSDEHQPTRNIGSHLQSKVLAFIQTWRQQRGGDCPLPELYRHLSLDRDTLTIGTFHDLMRAMHEQKQLSLTGWGGSLDRMPDPDLALFISNKVMYYAHS